MPGDESLTSPATPDEVATPNPLEGLDINVSMPTPEVRLVNASSLEEYQTWLAWASLLAATTVGFAVPCIQSFQTDVNVTLVFVMLAFAALAVVAGLRAHKYSKRLTHESNTYKMRLKAGEGLVRSDANGPEQ